MPLPHAREPTPPTAILIAQNRCRPCGIFTQHQSILNASHLRDRPKGQPHRNRRIPHRFLEPIHNVKDGKPNAPLPVRPDPMILILEKWNALITNRRFARPNGRPSSCSPVPRTGCAIAYARIAKASGCWPPGAWGA